MGNCWLFGHKYKFFNLDLTKKKSIVYIRCEKCFEDVKPELMKKFIEQVNKNNNR